MDDIERLGKIQWETTSQKEVSNIVDKNINITHDYRINIRYAKNKKSELARLCDVYGTDKGELTPKNNPYNWSSHSYTDLYELLFGQCRNNITNVLECGLGTNNPDLPSSMGINGKPGASLRVWRDYFPNADIMGLDIDKDVLFTEERIKTYYVDQTSPESIVNFFNYIDVPEFNIIIDDGLHEFHAGKCLFENAHNYLTEDGVYIIEDITPQDLVRYTKYFEDKTDEFYCRFINLHRPFIPLFDNSLLVITKN